MGQVIAIAVTLALLGTIMAVLLVKDHRRKSLCKDDGFVWNTTIEKRMSEEDK